MFFFVNGGIELAPKIDGIACVDVVGCWLCNECGICGCILKFRDIFGWVNALDAITVDGTAGGGGTNACCDLAIELFGWVNELAFKGWTEALVSWVWDIDDVGIGCWRKVCFGWAEWELNTGDASKMCPLSGWFFEHQIFLLTICSGVGVFVKSISVVDGGGVSGKNLCKEVATGEKVSSATLNSLKRLVE